MKLDMSKAQPPMSSKLQLADEGGPVEQSTPPTQRNGREAKRIELLNEAARTLNRRGVTQTSLASIAKNVGITRAAMYHYVDNQEDLVYQCYVRTCQQLSGLLNEAANRHTDALDIASDFIANALDENRPEFASLSDVAFLTDEKLSIVLGLYKGMRATLSDILSTGIERGELRPCAPRIAASILVGLITWAPVVLTWRPVGKTPKNALSKAIQDVMRQGIAANREAVVHFERIDFAPFIAIKGNVFDPNFTTEARKAALVTSASWLFNRKGIDATSLEEVALRLGVTKKVIYHNIGNKDDLVAECYRRGFRFSHFVVDATKDFSGARVNALCNSVASLADASVRQDIAPFAPITGLDAWNDDVQEELQGLASTLVDDYHQIFDQGMEEGSIRTLDTAAVVTMYPGFYEWMPRWLETFREEERTQIADEIASFLLLGLKPL